MTNHPELDAAIEAAVRWVDGLDARPIPADASGDQVRAALPVALPVAGRAAEEVIADLVAAVEPGLTGSGSSRFYGWVTGGSLPAARAADWLVTAWDQNGGMRLAAPGVAAVEELAGEWLVELLGLPSGSGVGFTTGATMANFSCLAAARGQVLRRAGWDVERDGLTGAPRVRVLAGAEVHTSVNLALRYLGLGAAELVRADDQGRLDADDLAVALAAYRGPTIVVLQAGNVHSGAFDPFAPAIAAARAAGAWVHVDGAFGLWALASPRLAPLVEGMTGADSWATDAHKTLNVPYDGGVAIVADPATASRALGASAAYLLQDAAPDPFDFVPEMSRRARGVVVWAALASLGRTGVTALVDGLVEAAAGIAAGLRALGVEVVNDVDYTQVCAAFGSDERTDEVLARLLADGEVRPSGSVWHGRHVIRFSVSNYGTDAAQVRRTLDAVERAVESVG